MPRSSRRWFSDLAVCGITWGTFNDPGPEAPPRVINPNPWEGDLGTGDFYSPRGPPCVPLWRSAVPGCVSQLAHVKGREVFLKRNGEKLNVCVPEIWSGSEQPCYEYSLESQPYNLIIECLLATGFTFLNPVFPSEMKIVSQHLPSRVAMKI